MAPPIRLFSPSVERRHARQLQDKVLTDSGPSLRTVKFDPDG